MLQANDIRVIVIGASYCAPCKVLRDNLGGIEQDNLPVVITQYNEGNTPEELQMLASQLGLSASEFGITLPVAVIMLRGQVERIINPASELKVRAALVDITARENGTLPTNSTGEQAQLQDQNFLIPDTEFGITSTAADYPLLRWGIPIHKKNLILGGILLLVASLLIFAFKKGLIK